MSNPGIGPKARKLIHRGLSKSGDVMHAEPQPWDVIDPPRRARFVDDKPGARAVLVTAGRPPSPASGRYTHFNVKIGGSGSRWVAAERLEFLD